MLRIGVDIGGTFTDFVVYDETSGQVSSFKLLSTPAAPEQAVLEGVRRLHPSGNASLVHGSTVATNALLPWCRRRAVSRSLSGSTSAVKCCTRSGNRSCLDWWLPCKGTGRRRWRCARCSPSCGPTTNSASLAH